MRDKRTTWQSLGAAADESAGQILISVRKNWREAGGIFRSGRTGSRGIKRGTVRFLAVFLAALLLLADTLPACAAGNLQAQEAPVSGGDVSGGDVVSDGDEVVPAEPVVSGGDVSGGDHSDAPGADPGSGDISSGDVSGGDVSGGDAMVSPDGIVSGGDVSGGDMLTEETPAVREPEQYYREPEPENYGTLTGYDAYSRTYHVEGNRYVTVIGNDGATYLDEEGKLRRIDNTLEETGTSLFGMLHTGRAYANRANAYTVLFPEDMPALGQETSGSGEPGAGIALAGGEHMLTLYPAEGNFAGGVARGNAIRYSNVFPGIDYQYTVLGSSVKEDIILLERGDKTSFSYYIDTWGLEAALLENTLYLYESGRDPEREAAFILEAPEMEDAAGEISFGVKLEVSEAGEMYLVTVTADRAWLDAPERAYPVRIDPTAVQISGSAIRLACAEEGSPNMVIGDNQYPFVGYDDGVTSGCYAGFGTRHRNCRTYFAIDYDFAALLAEAEITSASLQVTQKTRWSKGTAEFGLYRVEEEWQVNTLTWNNQLDYHHVFLDAQRASKVRGEALTFDVTEAVRDWVNGAAPNHGLVMKAQVEAPNAAAAAAGTMMQCEVLYASSSSSYGPRLILSWTGEPTELDALTLDDTTIEVYPVVERSGDRSTHTLGVVAHGLAKPGSTVHFALVNAATGERVASMTGSSLAENTLCGPDSALYQGQFPTALPMERRISNWQSAVFTGLTPGQTYYVEAWAEGTADPEPDPGEIVVGRSVQSCRFLLYEEGAFDLIPRIALHYGVEADTILADMQMADALTKQGCRIFIRDPQNTAPYSAGELSDYWRSVIDGLLLGRAENCVFGFEPVNLNTGNFYMEQTDASVPDIGGNFAFTRQYNSKGASYRGLFGWGWSSIYDGRLGELSDGRILWMTGTGAIVPFTRDGGSYQAPTGQDYVLTREEEGYVIEDLGTLTKYRFDGYGMLTALEDAAGNRTALSYDMDGRLFAVTSPSGVRCSVTLDQEMRLASLGLPDGNSIRYAYDSAGNLVSVTDQAGDVRRYTYDAGHRMTAWYDGNGNCGAANVYDGEGRVVEQTDAEGGKTTLSYAEGVTTTVDACGSVTVYRYDGQGRTTQIQYPDGTAESRRYNAQGYLAEVTDRTGVATAYTYDARGNVLSEVRQDGAERTYTYTESGQIRTATDFDGGVTAYAYDEKNRPVCVTDPEGNRTLYAYDSANRLLSVTDPEGNTATFAYEGACVTAMTDGAGNLWRYAYDAMNRQISATDPLGNTTEKTYNAKGWCVRETDGAGNTTVYTFDGAGNVTAITDREGNTSTFIYDRANRMLLAEDPLGNTLGYTYDACGRKLSETDAEGGVTSYAYDALGRLVEETDPKGNVTAYTYDGADRIVSVTDRRGGVTSRTYDDVTGSLSSQTDALGNRTVYETDVCGRTVKIIYADGSAVSYSYDKLGRILSVTDPVGMVTSLAYDGNGNLVSVLETDQEEGGERRYAYVYDALGRLVESVDPMGGRTGYAYDGAGNLILETDERENSAAYEYDALGRLIQVTDALGGVSAYTYDREGRLLTAVTPEGRQSGYTYDAIGQIREAVDGAGETVLYTYDALGRITSLTDREGTLWSWKYDANGSLTEAEDALGNTHTYRYDEEGNLISHRYPNGEEETYTYLATGEVASHVDRYGVKTTYTYDAMGRLTEAEDTAGNRMSYLYDGAGRLTEQRDVLGRSVCYDYDAYGRMRAKTDADGARTVYTYDAMDRLLSVTDGAGNVTAYTYDRAGSLTGQVLPGEAGYAYAYDALGRLVEAVDPLGAVTSYTYDLDGKLTGRTDGAGTQNLYGYDGLGRLVSFTDGNGEKTAYTYDIRGNLTSITTPEGITERYEYDGVGNLITVTDGSGEIWRYEYDSLQRLIRQISPLGAQESYVYDSHDVLTGLTDAQGAATRYEVDANGLVRRTILPNGGEYAYEYDAAHRVTSVTTPLGYRTDFTYSAGDDVIETRDSLGRVARYEYDVLHNLTGATDPEGGSTLYGYDQRNNRISVTDALGNTYTFAYDQADQMTAVTDPEEKGMTAVYDPAGNVESITAPGGRTTTYAYDGNYRLVSVTDPMGYCYSYAYDRDGRLTGRLDPLGQTESYAYDGAGRVTTHTDKLGQTERYTYDAHGNALTYAGPDGLVTSYTYDLLDRLTSVTDPMGSSAFYTYDVMGNLTGATDYLGRGSSYTYDLMGNLTSVTDAAGRTESLSYDAAGRCLSYAANSGNTVTYDYDRLNRLVEKAYTDAAGEEAAPPVEYAYDALGLRREMEDITGDTRYTYDALGRITGVTTFRIENEDGSIGRENGDEIGYAYNEADELAVLTYPDGSTAEYDYDLNGNLVKVTGRRGEVTSYEYDALNRITAIHRPNGVSTYQTYDAKDRVIQLTNLCDTCGFVLGSYACTYDSRGYLVAEHTREARETDPYDRQPYVPYEPEETDCGCTHGRDRAHTYRLYEADTTYTYDDAGKLLFVSETQTGCGTTSWRYGYDRMGNRIRAEKKDPGGNVVESGRYVYNESNQLTEAILCDGRKTTRVCYTYDADGNLTSEYSSTDNSRKTYQYTVENRLYAVYEGNTLLMAAAYDGDGNRVYQVNYNPDKDEDFTAYYRSYQSCDYDGTGVQLRADGEVSSTEQELLALIGSTLTSKYELIEYVNDVNREYTQVLVEQNINGRTDTVYTYGADRISSEMWNRQARTGYYLYDARGSVAGITDAKGQMTATYRYSAFGEMVYGAPEYENVYAYNGESYNPNIRSQYLRARYYNVATAAFLTEDSYLGEIMRPLTLNRYGYCLGNPVYYVDPSGHWIYDDELEQLQAAYDHTQQGNVQLSEMTAFLSALHELESANATVDYVLQYNYRGTRLEREYVWIVEQMAEQQNQGYACEIREHKRNFMDMHLSQKGIEALMYWETVNAYALESGYLQIVEKDGEKETLIDIKDYKEFVQVISDAKEKNTLIYLKGIAPHYVRDDSTTVGFGDYLKVQDIPYYESKGYRLSQNGNFVSIKDAHNQEIDFIPIDIIVEKYLLDIEGMEREIKSNVQKGINERNTEKLEGEKREEIIDEILVGQRYFDALIIARYNTGSLGGEAQGLIINGGGAQAWEDVLKSIGIGKKRRSWIIDTIMFGEGEYLHAGPDLQPLWGIHVEKIID